MEDYKIFLAINNGMIKNHDMPEDIIPIVFEYIGRIRRHYESHTDMFIDVVRWNNPNIMDKKCIKCKTVLKHASHIYRKMRIHANSMSCIQIEHSDIDWEENKIFK